MARPAVKRSEYFWVKFDWSRWQPGRVPQWEPASFDPNSRTWLLIGSREVIPEGHSLITVGPRLPEPPA